MQMWFQIYKQCYKYHIVLFTKSPSKRQKKPPTTGKNIQHSVNVSSV